MDIDCKELNVKLTAVGVLDVSKLTEVEFNRELEKGYSDILAGRTESADQVFGDIRKDLGI